MDTQEISKEQMLDIINRGKVVNIDSDHYHFLGKTVLTTIRLADGAVIYICNSEEGVTYHILLKIRVY